MSFNLKGEDVKEFTMLVLANTLLLSFTLVLSLDVPAEVKEAEEDMVDFGGSVLRKSGWLSIIWWGQRLHLESRELQTP